MKKFPTFLVFLFAFNFQVGYCQMKDEGDLDINEQIFVFGATGYFSSQLGIEAQNLYKEFKPQYQNKAKLFGRYIGKGLRIFGRLNVYGAGVLVGEAIYKSGLGEKIGTTQLGNTIGSKLYDMVADHNSTEKEFNSAKIRRAQRKANALSE